MTSDKTKMLITELLVRFIVCNGKRELAHGTVGTVPRKFKLLELNVNCFWKMAKEKRAKKLLFCKFN